MQYYLQYNALLEDKKIINNKYLLMESKFAHFSLVYPNLMNLEEVVMEIISSL